MSIPIEINTRNTTPDNAAAEEQPGVQRPLDLPTDDN